MSQLGRYGLFLCATLALSPTTDAAAVAWEVTRADDIENHRCPSADHFTLRGAVAVARNEDLIYFSPALGTSVVVELQSTLVVDKDIEIDGGHGDRLVIRPAGLFRPLVIRASEAASSARVLLTDLTIRDGVVLGAPGNAGNVPGGHGSPGGEALGGCLLVDGTIGRTSAQLTQVALRNCTVVGGDGGQGASGLDVDRGAGGAGGSGGSGGAARGAAIGVVQATLSLHRSSVSESFAMGGRGGNGGRGGGGSFTGGAGGSGGRGGDAAGGGIASPSTIYVDNSTFLANRLSGGDGGVGATGGRATAGASGLPGQHASAGDLAGGNILAGLALLELDHATLGPAGMERGTPGNWDGVSESGRGVVQGEAVFASGWRVRASVLVGTSIHSLCGGSVPQTWSGSGTSAASSDLCLQDESLHASVGNFIGDMAATLEAGRVVATPLQNSRLIDALVGCGPALDQSERLRPLDGDNDGVAACDIGAIEVVYTPTVFANGFER